MACDTEDGCMSTSARIMGTYMHGMFDSPEITELWLSHIGLSQIEFPALYGLAAKDRAYDSLAAHFEKHINVEEIIELLNR